MRDGRRRIVRGICDVALDEMGCNKTLGARDSLLGSVAVVFAGMSMAVDPRSRCLGL